MALCTRADQRTDPASASSVQDWLSCHCLPSTCSAACHKLSRLHTRFDRTGRAVSHIKAEEEDASHKHLAITRRQAQYATYICCINWRSECIQLLSTVVYAIYIREETHRWCRHWKPLLLLLWGRSLTGQSELPPLGPSHRESTRPDIRWASAYLLSYLQHSMLGLQLTYSTRPTKKKIMHLRYFDPARPDPVIMSVQNDTLSLDASFQSLSPFVHSRVNDGLLQTMPDVNKAPFHFIDIV